QPARRGLPRRSELRRCLRYRQAQRPTAVHRRRRRRTRLHVRSHARRRRHAHRDDGRRAAGEPRADARADLGRRVGGRPPTSMTPTGYALLLLTGMVGALVAVVMFAILRFMDAARKARSTRPDRGELALMSAALQEAVTKLKAQERATALRAEASERLSEEIIASLTA